jgi:hypothetical protein
MPPSHPRPRSLSRQERVRFCRDQPIPTQQPTSIKLTRSTDYYEQRCVKFPDRACFHCYAEFIHALLLEADGEVTHFVPQPFAMRVNRQGYIPDVYVVRNERIEVLELKPRGEMDPKMEIPVRTFFEQHGMSFRVVSNETVQERETLALNWLGIIQVLAQAQYLGIDTFDDETLLLRKAQSEHAMPVGDLLAEHVRETDFHLELALYRLLHRHELECDLSDCPLDYDTMVTPWH